MDISDALSSWDGEAAVVRHDAQTGSWFAVALHSTRLGPAAGGTRAMVYSTPGEAVADATKLAGAMTLKMAVAGLPMGGGKSVIALPAPRAEIEDSTWRRILELHAQNLEKLHGEYWTGPDVGTNSDDMDVLRNTTEYAFGRSAKAGGPGSSAEATALGVFEAMKAAAEEAGLGRLSGRRVLVQGLGEVGARVAALAHHAGADLMAADIDPGRSAAAQAIGAQLVHPDEVTRTPCDVLVPCATGGLIDAATAATIPCHAIAGAANNLLRGGQPTANVLLDRGIVLAPDFVANAGGALHLIGREVLGWTADEVHSRTTGIGDTLRDIFREARDRRISPEQAARGLADRRLA